MPSCPFLPAAGTKVYTVRMPDHNRRPFLVTPLNAQTASHASLHTHVGSPPLSAGALSLSSPSACVSFREACTIVFLFTLWYSYRLLVCASWSSWPTKAFVRVGPRLDRFEDASEVYVRTHKGTCIKWPQSAKKTRGARRPIEKKKKKKKSKAMTEARRNERAKCAAKVKERSGTRRHQARTTAADGGRQQ